MASQGLRNLGRSGLRVSPLCLGAMNFGNEQFGCDEKTSIGVIHAYLDAGHNFIDTANVYSGTRSETIVGKAVQGPPRCRRHRDQGELAAGAGPVRFGLQPQARREGLRGQPAPVGHGLHRPLSDAPIRRRHAGRGDAQHAQRPRSPGQGPLHRRLELDRVADRRGLL